jgi:hypothetical protein
MASQGGGQKLANHADLVNWQLLGKGCGPISSLANVGGEI